MATSGLTEMANLIPELWSPMMYSELRSKLILGNFFNRDYSGVISDVGSTVKINQITAPTAQDTTDDKALIESQEMNVNQIEVKADRIARASFEITNIAWLQSQEFQDEAREALVYSIMKSMETKIIAAMVPSASAPDHIIAPATASSLAQVDIGSIRTLLSTQSVPVEGRGLFLAPTYYGDLLGTNFASQDYIPVGSPSATGSFSTPVYGFQVQEHDGLSTDVGFGAHRSALSIVMSEGIQVSITDMKAAKKDAYLVMAKMIYGIKLMDNKRIVKISG